MADNHLYWNTENLGDYFKNTSFIYFNKCLLKTLYHRIILTDLL